MGLIFLNQHTYRSAYPYTKAYFHTCKRDLRKSAVTMGSRFFFSQQCVYRSVYKYIEAYFHTCKYNLCQSAVFKVCRCVLARRLQRKSGLSWGCHFTCIGLFIRIKRSLFIHVNPSTLGTQSQLGSNERPVYMGVSFQMYMSL